MVAINDHPPEAVVVFLGLPAFARVNVVIRLLAQCDLGEAGTSVPVEPACEMSGLD
jgi:hypothetical protein